MRTKIVTLALISATIISLCACSEPQDDGIIVIDGSPQDSTSQGTGTSTSSSENSDICFIHEGIVTDVEYKIGKAIVIFGDGSYELDKGLLSDEDVNGKYCWLYKTTDERSYILSLHKREGWVQNCSQSIERK